MARETIPKKIRETVLDEYDHRCAVCGENRPHLHHIDEEATNNVVENLLPLCPNCHLTDQHNPTRKIDIPKLQLFREFKDPSILLPQFHPLYLRQRYLDEIYSNEDEVTEIEDSAKELIEFVAAFEMGEFYSKQLKELIGPSRIVRIMFSGGNEAEYEQHRRQDKREYREKIITNRCKAKSLIIELLRYQTWANA